jgi:hypothetical protein
MQKSIQSQFQLTSVYSVRLNKKQVDFIKEFFTFVLPNSEPSTNPDTDIPRVEHASKNRATMKIIYDGQNPNDG